MNLMPYVTVVVMVLGLAGLIWCAKKQKTNPNAQAYAFICLVVVGICAISFLVQTGAFGGGGENASLIKNELAFTKSRAVVVGRYLAQKYPNSKVLVLTDVAPTPGQKPDPSIEGLKEGIGSALTIDAVESLVPDQSTMKPEEMRPIEMMITAAAFDKAVAKHSGCNVVVSLFGLPMDAGNMAFWKMSESNRPKLAVLSGDTRTLKKAIFTKFIIAAVAMRPDLKSIEEKANSDPQKAFDSRYLLITPDNIVQLTKDNPHLFD